MLPLGNPRKLASDNQEGGGECGRSSVGFCFLSRENPPCVRGVMNVETKFSFNLLHVLLLQFVISYITQNAS